MKSLLAALVLLLVCFTSPLIAKDTMRADAAYGVRYTEARVAAVPQDHNKPYITVIGSQSDPRYQQLVSWFESNPTLAQLKADTNFNAIPTENPHYYERLAGDFPATPCVVMQDAHGNPVVEFKPNELPATADALATGLNRQATTAEAMGLFCRRNEEVKPAPNKNAPLPPASPAKRVSRVALWCVLGVLCLVAGIAAVAKSYRDQYYSI